MFSRFTRFTHLRTAPKFKYTQKLVKLFRVFVRIQCMQTFFLCIIIVSIILIKICIDFDAFSWNFHQAEHSRKNWEVLKSLFSEFLKRSENFSWILREFWSNSDVERSEWFGRSAIESFNPGTRASSPSRGGTFRPSRSTSRSGAKARPAAAAAPAPSAAAPTSTLSFRAGWRRRRLS